jgi:hypothetical protein
MIVQACGGHEQRAAEHDLGEDTAVLANIVCSALVVAAYFHTADTAAHLVHVRIEIVGAVMVLDMLHPALVAAALGIVARTDVLQIQVAEVADQVKDSCGHVLAAYCIVARMD